MPAFFLALASLFLPLLARIGIGTAVGSVVYLFFTSTVVPAINQQISALISESTSFGGISALAQDTINYIGIPIGVSLVAATWAICLSLSAFRLALSFLTIAK